MRVFVAAPATFGVPSVRLGDVQDVNTAFDVTQCEIFFNFEGFTQICSFMSVLWGGMVVMVLGGHVTT